MTCLACDLHNFILENYTWDALLRLKRQSTPYGDIAIVSSKTERSDYDSYGEYDQGSSETVWIVFRLEPPHGAAERFFRKEGTADSYGEVSWDRTFREVKATEKTVTVYEWD